MKRKVINAILSLFILAFSVVHIHAQDRQRSSRFIATVQYAGSIGFISVGGGVTSKNRKLHYEFLYGHVPKQYGGPTDKISLKGSWYPATVSLSKGIKWKPVNPGIFAAFNFGDRFSIVPSRSKYSKGYYWWSPGLRVHVSFNSALTFRLSRRADRQLMLFFETNTNDRYLTIFFSDENRKEMSFSEIWMLGCGGKVLF